MSVISRPYIRYPTDLTHTKYLTLSFVPERSSHIQRIQKTLQPPPAVLRESYRESGKVKTRTVANLSGWPDAKVEARRPLRGETVIAAAERVESRGGCRMVTLPRCWERCAAIRGGSPRRSTS